jgi:hypothetical protein
MYLEVRYVMLIGGTNLLYSCLGRAAIFHC